MPYTSYSAKTSYLKEYPDVIQKFTNGLQMGMEFVREHTPEEIAAGDCASVFRKLIWKRLQLL